MHHPYTRGERRHERERVIARRRFVWEAIWQVDDGVYEHSSDYRKEHPPEPRQWGVYAKFNMNCGCTMCHGAKYFKCKDKRRKALKTSDSQAEFRVRDRAMGKY